MDFHLKDGSSYIDDVPMKISPKFIPPSPVGLPSILDNRTSADLLKFQYDFSFERQVIESSQRRLLELKTLKEKGQSSIEVECNKSTEDSKKQQSGCQSSVKCVLPLQPDIILQPKPIETHNKDPNEKSVKINLSDFENDTSSPFDYMELQTINDLEVLSSVFQGFHESTSFPITCTGNTVAKSVSLPLSQISWQNPTTSPPTVINPQFSEAETAISNSPAPVDQACLPDGDGENMLSKVTDRNSNSSLSQVPCVSNSSERTSLRGSKSYSDFHSISDLESFADTGERSQTPPTIACSTLPTDSEDVLTIKEDYFAAELSKSNNGGVNYEYNAYEELDDSSKKFVDSITEMGFAQGQVARAVKHLGTDEKKVVEHLCHIQVLEESGYESWEAEAALHLHDYNREQAKAFLDLVIQFQDLGFEKDAVKKALTQNKNDWNKTIDALLP